MATTTNYGWATPDDTDLVKDGAAAIRTLGTSIDTSFAADEGDLLVGGTSDIFEALPIGAAGTVLTSDGDTAEWAAVAGGMTLISSTEVNATAATYTISSIPTTYKSLLFVGINCSSDSGTDTTIGVELNGDTSTNYDQNGFGWDTGAVDGESILSGTSFSIQGPMARTADAVARLGSFMAWINNASSASTNKGWSYSASSFSGGTVRAYTENGKWRNTSSAVTSLRFFTTGANFKTGTFLLYGLS